jgi:hypothetical protein
MWGSFLVSVIDIISKRLRVQRFRVQASDDRGQKTEDRPC